MFSATLVGLSLVLNVTFEPTDLTPNFKAPMTQQQKFAALRPLIRSATDCVVRAITTDPRFRPAVAGADMNELIVASMAPCADAMQNMIEAHDRLFGAGSGEAFFMGPYLEGLPITVDKLVRDATVHDRAPADQ
jgi:hypothetical protein